MRASTETFVHHECTNGLIFPATLGRKHRLHVVGTSEKTRMATISVHGHAWKRWPSVGDKSPVTGTVDGVGPGAGNAYDGVDWGKLKLM